LCIPPAYDATTHFAAAISTATAIFLHTVVKVVDIFVLLLVVLEES